MFFLWKALKPMKKIILTLLAAVYALSPYDVLPDFLVGWGWLDDLLILYLLWRYVYSPYKKKFDFGRYSQQRQRTFRKESTSSKQQETHNNSYSQTQKRGEDPYTVLGLDKGASTEEIQKAYKTLANKYHPDKVQHLGEEFRELAEKRFKEIQQAYQYLKNE
jgi:uncharacterized membrane protein YkvA (DUF1232 family)